MTLIELVVALAITSLVLAGVGAAVRLAAGALPGRDDALAGLLRGQRFLDEFLDSISTATGVESLGATGVSFTVPDRDEDGDEEELAYAWSSTSGEPVLLVVNGGAPVQVLDACDGLAVSAITGDGLVRAVQVSLIVSGRTGVLRSGTRLLSMPEAP
ncbi:MAG: hypothetical protein IT439_12815 [Phycisphaerales bacterium]|nr:hypothetical protein [Phycisphaerales bacterium]